MEHLIPLWLPILVTAAVVWVISAIVWMALPHHKQDFIRLPDEDGFMDYMRRSGIIPHLLRRTPTRRAPGRVSRE